MNFISVESSNLKGVFYDAKEKKLFVKFKNDSLYSYEDVPKFVYKDLMNAESKGLYFANNIRGKYAYENITGKE